MVTSPARLARATTVVTVIAVAALPVTAGCVIGHAYLAATAALLLSAVTGACGWVLVGRHDTPGTSTAVHPAEREGGRVTGHAG